MQEIVGEVEALLEANEPFALVTLVEKEGSTPRAAGAEMLVRSDGSIAGTVGGGLLEATAIRQASEAIAGGRSSLLTMELRGADVEGAAMLCGGLARLLIAFVPAGHRELFAACSALTAALDGGRPAVFVTTFGTVAPDGGCDVTHSLIDDVGATAGSPLSPAEVEAILSSTTGGVRRLTLPDGREHRAEPVEPPPLVVICGAGHVGRALAPAAAAVGFAIAVVDDRPEFASPERFPAGTRLVVPADFAHAFESVELGERTYVVIATRGHRSDFALLEQVLRSEAAYIGLMASSRKRRRFYETLLERGFTAQELERIRSPIGLAIDAETPAELAVSIVGELIQVRAALRHA